MRACATAQHSTARSRVVTAALLQRAKAANASATRRNVGLRSNARATAQCRVQLRTRPDHRSPTVRKRGARRCEHDGCPFVDCVFVCSFAGGCLEAERRRRLVRAETVELVQILQLAHLPPSQRSHVRCCEGAWRSLGTAERRAVRTVSRWNSSLFGHLWKYRYLIVATTVPRCTAAAARLFHPIAR